MTLIRDVPANDQVDLFSSHAIDYGVLMMDDDGVITYWSSGAERITGWTGKDAIGQPVAMIFTPEDRAAGAPKTEMETARCAGSAPDVRWHMCKDGRRFFADGVVTAIQNANGKVIGFGKILRDATERKQQNEYVERRASLLDLAYDPAFCWNLTNDQILYWNNAAQDLYGYEANEALFQNHDALLKTVFTNKGADAKESLKCTGRWHGLLQHTTKDGRTLYVASRMVLRTDLGEQSIVLETSRDVTTQKQAEMELRQREERYRALFNSIEEGFTIVELIFDESGKVIDHRYVEANPSATRISGWGNVIGKLSTEIHPAFDPSWRAVYAKVLDTGIPAQFIVEAPEVQRWLDFSITRIGDGSNNQLAILARDITNRRRNKNAFRRREERYRALFNSITQGFLIIELIFNEIGTPINYRFVEANPAAERLTGLKNFVGKTLLDIVPSPKFDWIEIYGRVAQSGTSIDFIDYSPALKKWFDVSVSPLGKTPSPQVALLFTDITETKKDEERLRHLATSLEEANRRQNEFLATLAHELRNPLAPIRTGLDLLRSELEVSPPVAKIHQIIDRQVRHLVHLVDDLLDLGRINNGKIELKKMCHLLNEIVQNAIETSLPAINAKGHEFIVQMPEDAIWINADANRLSQVVSNVLNNAARYTPKNGKIVLSLEHENNEAVIRIVDNGIGIAPEDLPKIFDMFSQVGHSLDQTEGGLGIGLHLVKRLAAKHGGTVDVSSLGLGQGTTFTICLPLVHRVTDVAPAEALEVVKQAENKPLHIVVADDNRDAAELLKELLEVTGHQVKVVHDGKQALDVIRRLKPDLALLDINMPMMNGYEVAQAVRSDPLMNNVLLAALTGWGMQEDHDSSQKAGFSYHLVKPVDFNKLLDLIAKVH